MTRPAKSGKEVALLSEVQERKPTQAGSRHKGYRKAKRLLRRARRRVVQP